MKKSSRCNALVLDPCPRGRDNLRQATRALYEFDQVKLFDSVHDLAQVLEGELEFQILYVSDRVSLEETEELKRLLWKTGAEDVLSLVYVRSEKDYEDILDLERSEQFHAVLCEPYSAQQLLELLEVLSEVQVTQKQNRFQRAMDLLVYELMGQIGQIARLRKRGHPAGISELVFREMCSALQHLNDEQREAYFEAVLTLFPRETYTRQRIVGSKGPYCGISQRVRRRFSEKAVGQFKKALGA